MKKTIVAVAAVLFATGASAANIYHGFGGNNPDLYTGNTSAPMTVTDSGHGGGGLDRYQGWANGNPDLVTSTGGSGSTHRSPDRYRGFDDGNSDLYQM